MRLIWTTTQVRAAEQAVLRRTPDGALMRRAAFGVAGQAIRLLALRTGGTAGRRVTLLIGAGDNGGDALWAGAQLRRRGVAVTAVLLDPGRAHPVGLAALRATRGRVLVASAGSGPAAGRVRTAIAAADLVVDGIVGISGRGPLRPLAADLVACADVAGVPVLAVDLPSGVDPDTGTAHGPAVNAAATVTFGALKPAHVLAPQRCGPVHLIDIGIGGELEAGGEPDLYVLEAADVGRRWPVPGPSDDKYTQGVVGVAAGSAVYPGAAVLATGGAALASSGMVRYAGPAADQVRASWPEVIATAEVTDAGRVQAWVVGPGMGADDVSRAAFAAVLAADLPTCVDADAITLLATHAELTNLTAARTAPLLLTPHEREFARIAGDMGADRVAATRAAAARLGATVLLKGNVTVVADPAGRALVHPSTASWAATAGSGDVLSGMLGALLASGMEPWWAAGCATHVHGVAASLAAAGAPVPASRLLQVLSHAIRQVRAAASDAPSGASGSPPGRSPGPESAGMR